MARRDENATNKHSTRLTTDCMRTLATERRVWEGDFDDGEEGVGREEASQAAVTKWIKLDKSSDY